MAQRKETKKKLILRDLQPKKGAKGGATFNRSQHNNSTQNRNNQGHNINMVVPFGGQHDEPHDGSIPKRGFVSVSRFLDQKMTAPHTRAGMRGGCSPQNNR